MKRLIAILVLLVPVLAQATYTPVYRVDYSAQIAAAEAQCAGGDDGDTNIYNDSGDFTSSRLNDAGTIYHCVIAGDYSDVDMPTLTRDGTSGTLRWLLHSDCNDGDANSQSAAERAEIEELNIQGDYWVIHCMEVTDPDNDTAASTFSLLNIENATNVTVLNSLIHDSEYTLIRIIGSAHDARIQDNVLHTTQLDNSEASCIVVRMESADGDLLRPRIVSNEIYNCHGDAIQFNTDSVSNTLGILDIVVEDNDGYMNNDWRTDCGTGQLSTSGNCGCMENFVDIKIAVDGTPSDTSHFAKLLGNRVHGLRSVPASQAACPNLGNINGPAFDFHGVPTDNDEADYIIARDNIVWDNESCFWMSLGDVDHVSIINNICYEVAVTGSGNSSSAAFVLEDNCQQCEIYLNAVIKSGEWIDARSGSNPNNNLDTRGNALLFSGSGDIGSPGSGSNFSGNYAMRADSAAFDMGSGALCDVTDVDPRANSTAYTQNALACSADYVTNNGWVYRVTTSGTSGSTTPTFNESIGATTTDGSVVLTAVMGPLYLEYHKKTTENMWVKFDYADTDNYHSLAPFSGLPGNVGMSCTNDRGVTDTPRMTGQGC